MFDDIEVGDIFVEDPWEEEYECIVTQKVSETGKEIIAISLATGKKEYFFGRDDYPAYKPTLYKVR